MSTPKCRVPDCRSTSIHLRNLCRSCYIYAATLVFHKLVSWEQLEAADCVGPASGQVQSPKRPARTDWFSRATGYSPDALTEELRRRVYQYEITRKPERPRRKKTS